MWMKQKKMIQTYFGKINAGISLSRYYPAEEKILAHRTKQSWKKCLRKDFSLAFPYCGRMDPDFYAVDFMTDIFVWRKIIAVV